MKLKLDLNIYQLPGKALVAKQDITGWGLKKIMAFAEIQLNYNRLCSVADDSGGPLDSLKVRTRAEKL